MALMFVWLIVCMSRLETVARDDISKAAETSGGREFCL